MSTKKLPPSGVLVECGYFPGYCKYVSYIKCNGFVCDDSKNDLYYEHAFLTHDECVKFVEAEVVHYFKTAIAAQPQILNASANGLDAFCQMITGRLREVFEASIPTRFYENDGVDYFIDELADFCAEYFYGDDDAVVDHADIISLYRSHERADLCEMYQHILPNIDLYILLRYPNERDINFLFDLAVSEMKQLKQSTKTESKTEMTTVSKIVETNKTLAVSAATLEAGRIANNTAAKLISKKLPVMVRGYADTAIGKIVMANLAKLAVDHFKSDNKVAVKIADAMIQQAYIELIQEVDIEGFLEELLSNKTLLAKANKIPDSE